MFGSYARRVAEGRDVSRPDTAKTTGEASASTVATGNVVAGGVYHRGKKTFETGSIESITTTSIQIEVCTIVESNYPKFSMSKNKEMREYVEQCCDEIAVKFAASDNKGKTFFDNRDFAGKIFPTEDPDFKNFVEESAKSVVEGIYRQFKQEDFADNIVERSSFNRGF